VAVTTAVLLAPAGVGADDWPQFHGPRRDNISRETGLLERWPAGGPKHLWAAQGLGYGFSSVSLADGLLYTTGNIGDETVITALDRSGQVRWRAPNGPAYDRDHPGTRGTPTIDAGRLYHLNADGDVVCLEARSGRWLWGTNILERFDGRNPTWGLAESLLVDQDRVICTPGGTEIGLAALDKHAGKTVWTCTGTNDEPGYCSPIVVEHGGLRQIVTLLAASIVGVHAETGRRLWQVPHVTYAGENTSMPLFHDGRLLISTQFTGARLLQLTVRGETATTREVWHNEDLNNQHGGMLLVDGYVYGSSRRGPGGNRWFCLDFETGRTVFAGPGIGRATATYADGKLYVVNHEGLVALVQPRPDRFEVVSRFQIPEGGQGPVWAHPVVSGGRLYLRHGDLLHCFDLEAP
jgi:outer membrane protein assembly factor BamB